MSDGDAGSKYSSYQFIRGFLIAILLISATGCLYPGDKRGHPPTPYEPEVQQRIETREVPETHDNATLENPEAVEFWVVAFVNYERLESDREPLVRSPRLGQVADYRSYDMWNRSYFGHYDPDGDGFQKYLAEFEYSSYSSGSENIVSEGYKTKTIGPEKESVVTYEDPKRFAKALVQRWMISGEHRWALMHADYSVTGVGVYGEPSGEVKATHLFVDRERFDEAVDANTTDEFRVPVAEEDPLEDESGLENYPSHLGSNDDDR